MNPTDAQYGSGVHETIQHVQHGGGLPMTGFDVLILGAVAIALILSGLILHRLSRPNRQVEPWLRPAYYQGALDDLDAQTTAKLEGVRKGVEDALGGVRERSKEDLSNLDLARRR